MKYTIKATPFDVRVADDRNRVPGCKVRVESEDGYGINGTVIPQEGNSPDCWLGTLIEVPHALWDSLDDAARCGAKGEEYSDVLEVEES